LGVDIKVRSLAGRGLTEDHTRLNAELPSLSVTSATERRERLKVVYDEARACVRCPLHQTRTTVVFGSGNANADLMFVGEAPGANEDRLGLPFVGQAGKLLEKLLGEIGLQREDVFIANTLKCRPPGNRDPHPNEIESCSSYLRSQVELIEPKVICTLGNFATKLLRGDTTGISRLHGQEEVRVIGARAVRLYPLYHPAAALYTPSTLEMLRSDFRRIPELLAVGAPAQPDLSHRGDDPHRHTSQPRQPPRAHQPPEALEHEPGVEVPPWRERTAVGAEPDPAVQLGLF
jgi:uracil-DNA glycosylase family 4